MKQYYKYIIIFLIVLISLLGFFIYCFNNEFVDNFSLNLLTEIIGIFITIIVIDKLLDYGKEKEKKRIKEIIHRKLEAKIKDIARLYVEIYKVLYSLSFSTLLIWIIFPFDLFLFNMLLLQLPTVIIKKTTLHGYLSGNITTVTGR